MQNQQPGIWLHGCSGRMGQEIQTAIAKSNQIFRFIGGSAATFSADSPLPQGEAQGPVTAEKLAIALVKPEVQVVIDFTNAAGNALLLEAFRTALPADKLRGKAVLIGTTGLDALQLAAWRELAQKLGLSLLIAPNTSIGILLLAKTALLAAGVLSPLGYDIEIVETHHRMKLDAPSGTARFLVETIQAGVRGLRSVFQRPAARTSGEIGVHAVRGGGVFGEHEIRIIGADEELKLSHRAFSRALFASGALVLAQWLLKQKSGIYSLLDIQIKDLK